jgi:hypothetical protein
MWSRGVRNVSNFKRADAPLTIQMAFGHLARAHQTFPLDLLKFQSGDLFELHPPRVYTLMMSRKISRLRRKGPDKRGGREVEIGPV